MTYNPDKLKEVLKRVNATKYSNVIKEMIQNGHFPSEQYLRKLRQEEQEEIETELAKLKKQ
jgi:hypothetical protein